MAKPKRSRPVFINEPAPQPQLAKPVQGLPRSILASLAKAK